MSKRFKDDYEDYYYEKDYYFDEKAYERRLEALYKNEMLVESYESFKISCAWYIGQRALKIFLNQKIKKGDYEGALPLGAARYEAVRLESSKAAKDVRQEFDILAANYVNLNPASVAAFSEELSWFAEFTDRWGMNDFLQKNMDNAYNNLIILCLKENAISRIEEFEEKYQSYVSANQISKTKQLYQETIWLNKLNDYMNQREYQTGLREADEALRLLPQSTRIKNMRTYFYNNCIAVIHNNFAAEANAGRFEEALKIISEGLELFPNDKTLRKDYNELIKILDS